MAIKKFWKFSKKDLQGYAGKFKKFCSDNNIIGFTLIFLWYSFMLYLLLGYFFKDYSIKLFLASFALYVIYEAVLDDVKDIIAIAITTKK